MLANDARRILIASAVALEVCTAATAAQVLALWLAGVGSPGARRAWKSLRGKLGAGR